jgi:hypothetical protein
MFWLISYPFGQVCQQEKHNKMATKDRTLVAISLWVSQLPENLYQKDAGFLLRSRY